MPAVQIHPALSAMRTHLLTKKADWSLRSVDDWPSYVEGTGGPSISLAVSSFRPTGFQFAYPTMTLDVVRSIDVTYWSDGFRPRTHYNDVLIMLENILLFLLASSRPNNYGEILGQGADIVPEIGSLATNDPSHKLFGGTISVPHFNTEVVTQT